MAIKTEFIDFPKCEYEAYLKRLNAGKVIYTTRVSSEVGKYSLGSIYSSPFGMLKVVSLIHFKNLDSHPFLEELTPSQKEEIEKYAVECGIDLVGLNLVNN